PPYTYPLSLHDALPIYDAVVGVHLAAHLGTGADHTHVAAQHVEELGQFVEAVFAQEPADRGDARVVLELEEQRVAAVVADQLVRSEEDTSELQSRENLV